MGFFGDWPKLKMWANRMKAAAFVDDYADELRALGDTISSKVKNHIQRQDLRWTPLSEATIRRKGHGKVYVETREYLNSIDAQVVKRGRIRVRLDVWPSGQHRPSGLSMQQLATYLEHGTSKIPARPLWRPTFKEVPDDPQYKRMLELGPKFGFKAS